MSQGGTASDLDQAVGYILKQAATTLRGAMDAALRPLDLTVPQYACLELLGRQPDLSNAALARGAFVTRQSMNLVLRGLQDRGLVTRPAQAARGRELPTKLTPAGHDKLRTASVAVQTVEQRMVTTLTADARRQLRHHLTACIAALTDEDD